MHTHKRTHRSSVHWSPETRELTIHAPDGMNMLEALIWAHDFVSPNMLCMSFAVPRPLTQQLADAYTLCAL